MILLEQFIKKIRDSSVHLDIAKKLAIDVKEVNSWLDEYLDGELPLGAELALRKAAKGQRILGD